MNPSELDRFRHDHVFDQDLKKSGENKTLLVIAITLAMMLVEIVAGLQFGSMALLADGLHMGSHAAALSISAIAYRYARRHAHSQRYSFGTGKVNALGGYTGAVLLAIFALYMAVESGIRLVSPRPIQFDYAILVAVIGLIVNAVCALILGHDDHHHDHDHDHNDDHHHAHGDHNLRSAYLHVLADALTSILAIIALILGRQFGTVWMDPLMGLVGAVLITRWSYGLLKSTSGVLLDEQAPAEVQQKVIEALEEEGITKVIDLHIWTLGPQGYSAEISLLTRETKSPDEWKQAIPDQLGLVHLTIEVNQSRVSSSETD